MLVLQCLRCVPRAVKPTRGKSAVSLVYMNDESSVVFNFNFEFRSSVCERRKLNLWNCLQGCPWHFKVVKLKIFWVKMSLNFFFCFYKSVSEWCPNIRGMNSKFVSSCKNIWVSLSLILTHTHTSPNRHTHSCIGYKLLSTVSLCHFIMILGENLCEIIAVKQQCDVMSTITRL